MPTRIGLTVVLPAFNEREALKRAVERYLEAFSRAGLLDFELLLVDDGSRDGTREMAEHLAGAHREARVVVHEENRGQAAALRTGFAASRGALVTHNGVDLPFAPEDTPAALALISDSADVVVVERLDRSSYAVGRKVVSWGNVLAWRWLFGSPLRDHNFVQFYRREVLESIAPCSLAVNTLTPELILRAHRKGFRVVSLGLPYHRREMGKSSVRLQTVTHSAWAVAQLWWAVRRGAWDGESGVRPARSEVAGRREDPE